MDQEQRNTGEPEAIRSAEDLERAIHEVEQQEQLYSIALFDILGFSNFVQEHGTQTIRQLYDKLVGLIHRMESNAAGDAAFSGSVVPARASADWKENQLIADANGYIHVCHFSDTFLIYTHYLFKKQAWWLRDAYYEPYPLLLGQVGSEYAPIFYEEHPIYLSFLQVCMEFFCEAICAGIPLRGCIATGMATLDKHESVYFGRPLVEAARGEPAQNAIGVAFGRSFQNYHPVYNRYFIPYLANTKQNDSKAEFLSPMMLDWPRFWRGSRAFQNCSIEQSIRRMNTDPNFSGYYDNAIRFAAFSQKHENWAEQLDREGMGDIQDYYARAKAWFESAVQE